MILYLYVNDIILAIDSIESIKTTKKWMSNHFKMKDMGETTFILGIKTNGD